MCSFRLRSPSLRGIPVHRPLSTLRGRSTHRGPRNSIIRPGRTSQPKSPAHAPEQLGTTISEAQDALSSTYDPAQNTLLSPVYLPEDPNGVLKEDHPAANLLANSGLVVQRQLEMMNVMIGFEQANKYVIMDAQGNHIGYMAEQEKGMANAMARQWFRTHRSFVTHVFDRHENEVLRFNRPFSWINSRIRVYDPLDISSNNYTSSTSLHTTTPGSLVQADISSNARVSPLGLDEMRVVGEAQQQWAPLRRKYNLFTYHQSPNSDTDMGTHKFPLTGSNLSKSQQIQLAQASKQGQGEFNQFAYVDEPFLSWDFSLRSAENRLIGSVNRNFAGFAREIFTDTGVYALRMDSAASVNESSSLQTDSFSGMTLDQRAVMLATAVTVDFDYFSRHSGSGGFGFMPFWFPGFGGGAAAGEAAGAAGGAAAGEAGAMTESAAGAIGRAGAAGGVTDGIAAGAAGAGAMAGYEAMQRGLSGSQSSQTPGSDQPGMPPSDQQQPDQPGASEDVWSESAQDPWAQEDQFEDPWSDGGSEGGGDDFDWF
ncbi:Scramblase-domain-containing protein [Penicillium macrosclerotiorum]|uniref:Scramblase-domain-containing protein n=1 Tax=Penicillium macrosclerotiorum TaxID=303699 RepID=UPI0025467DD4|nr:Scramblase-domain-containing protein [Penicillium macrosclerotiorum]KAJ5689377.1 Scramblase-domain-containing protein [Penicillium macrosclerotiorum]